MGAGGDKEIEIKITVDAQGAVKSFEQLGRVIDETKGEAKDAEQGFTRLEATVTALNSAVQLGVQVYNLASGAFNTLFNSLNRGDDIANITANFQRLSAQAGEISQQFESRLLTAVDGTISRFDTLSIATKGLLLNLEPSTIELFAASADKLGDAVGISATDAFNTLTQSVGKGNLKILESVGISADAIDVFETYATAIGKTKDELTKQEQALANQAVATSLVQTKLSTLSDTTRGAGENLLIFQNTLEDLRDRFLQAISSNATLNLALSQFNNALKQVDFSFFEKGIAKTFVLVEKLAEKFNNFALNLRTSQLSNETSFGQGLEELASRFRAADKEGKTFAETALKNKFAIEALSNAFFNLGEEAQKRFAPFIKQYANALLEAGQETQKLGTGTKGVIKPLSEYEKLLERIQKDLKGFSNESKGAGKETKSFLDLISSANSDIRQAISLYKDGAIDGQAFADALSSIGSSSKNAGIGLEEFQRVQNAALAEAELLPTTIPINPKLEIDQLRLKQEEQRATVQIVDSISQSVLQTARIIADGRIGKDEFGGVGAAVGSIIGGIIGAFYGDGGTIGSAAGAQVGAAAGSILGELTAIISEALGGRPSSREKKEIDAFFSDLFSKDRLTVVVGDELRAILDLDFSGGEFGNPETGFFDVINTASENVRDSFDAVALAVSTLFDSFDEIGYNLSAVFANNVGTSLNNLQILIKQAGLSFEELSDQIVRAFNNGQVSAIEANQALVNLQEIMTDGIPGAAGDTTQALQNLFDAGARGGTAAIDALQDIAFEAQEAQLTSLQQAQQLALQSGELTAEQINAVFETLTAFGIDTIEELATASETQIIAVLANLQGQGILTDTTATIADTAAAIEAIPSNQEKRVTFIADVQYTDRANTPQGQAVITSAGASPRQFEGVA